MTTLKCSDCPVIFEGEIISSWTLETDDPELQKLMDTAGCPDCGAPMYEVTAP